MNPELSHFAARLRALISNRQPAIGDGRFSELALELFLLQFQSNAAYRKICETRGCTPATVAHWTQIPAVPTGLFKELELTSIPPDERTAVFHSSGTTEQKPSRHFHGPESLALYAASLWAWFAENVTDGAPDSSPAGFQSGVARAGQETGAPSGRPFQPLILTPRPKEMPHSSLVHMFEIVREKLGGAGVSAHDAEFFGALADDGVWTLDFARLLETLARASRITDPRPLLLLGTAFSFVHLLDHLAEQDLRFALPGGSRVMETGGYKNRSRSLPKAELHALIIERLGVPPANILCEYGMSELSSQAYDAAFHCPSAGSPPRVFHFPPWARAQIISPETGREADEGETGLIRILDLANVFSVMAIQTEDLGIRRGDGFELIGRAQLAEPRGCSLMSA